MCIETWGRVIRERLDLLESWAHKQGLELAAECHLAKINQCADFLQVMIQIPRYALELKQQLIQHFTFHILNIHRRLRLVKKMSKNWHAHVSA